MNGSSTPARPAAERPTFAEVSARARAAASTVEGVTRVEVRLGVAASTPGHRGPSGGPERADGQPTRPPAVIIGPPLRLPEGGPATLIEALLRAGEGERGTTFLLADGRTDRQSYGDLLRDAACVLPGLRAAGLRPGDSVLLSCDDNRNFTTGFWACLLGGFVPTPVAVAPTYASENTVTRRLRSAWELLDQPPLLTDRRLATEAAALGQLWGDEAPVILAVEDLRQDEPTSDLYRPAPDHPAVHLLTSGSTGVPKCVRHDHRTVVLRAQANCIVNGFGTEDVTLNFMPLDHVAGFVMHNLRDVVVPAEHVNARTDAFIADPLRWFSWIERFQVTNTSAPNFVITLVTKLADEIGRGSWDLSSLRDITNGGEAIVAGTTHEFLRLLAPHGLRPDVMRPAWGMSELCGGVVHSTLDRRQPTAGSVTINRWGADGRLTFLPAPAPGHTTFTEVGAPAPGAAVRIVDAHDEPVLEDQIGRLQVKGPTLMVGYYRNPEATAAATTRDGWFDTGDLGFVHGGRLVMTGRDKDVLIIRSANFSCHEIEAVAGDVAGVEPTFVAACGVFDPEAGTDELLLFCVFRSEDPAERQAVVREMTRRVATQVGVAPRGVVPVARDAFPKTSAGKIERRRLLSAHDADAFEAEIRPVGHAAAPAGSADPPSSFTTVWTPQPSTSGPLPTGTWLVFDPGDLALRLAPYAPGRVVAVHADSGWNRTDDEHYRIDPTDPHQFEELIASVSRDHGALGAVVHAWAWQQAPGCEQLSAEALERSGPAVHRLLRAAGPSLPPCLVVTSGASGAVDDEPVVPERATVVGIVRTANLERGGTILRHLDLASGDPDGVSAIIDELTDTSSDDLVARRSGQRVVARVRPVDPLQSTPAHHIRPEGLYLVTGGLGRIGAHLAEHLITTHGCTVIVLGRSEPGGVQAQRLAHLVQLGAVEYLQADVADAAALHAGIDAAEARAGQALDGVVHVAGAEIDGNWRNLERHLLVNEDPSALDAMYHAKVHGTRSIATVLEDRPNALLVLVSSVNGFFGGAGFGAYASACSFLPAFAEHWRQRGRAAQCHAWSLWTGPTVPRAREVAVEHHGFCPVEASDVPGLFEGALADPAGHVLIGLDEARSGVARHVDSAAVATAGLRVAYEAGGVVVPAAVYAKIRAALGPEIAIEVRPAAGSPLVARSGDVAEEATGDLESVIAAVWQSVLRLTTIRPDDHFFDLGGDSLTAMRLIARLNSELDDVFDVLDLYERPTVRELAGLVGQRRAGAEADHEER